MKKLYASLFTALMLFSNTAFSQSVKVMTYNIRYDNPSDGADTWGNRKQGLTELLLRNTPDVLGMQEVLNGQLQFISAALKGYDYIGVGRDDGATAGEYSPLFYRTKRFAKIKGGWFWLSATPDVPGKGWDAACTRICTWAMLKDKTTKKDVMVLNTHLDHEGKMARENSIRQLLDFIKQTGEEYVSEATKQERIGLPVVLMGDFNLTPADPLYQQLTSSNIVLKEGLTDAFLTTSTPPVGETGTFNAFNLDKAPTSRIDYVWSSGYDVKSYKSIDTKLSGGRWPSDHLPVLVELEPAE